MPSYIIHLAAAKLALDRLGDTALRTKYEVYTGSILADTMPRTEKVKSHFWNEETLKLLKRAPDLDMFRRKYGEKPRNPLVAAYYAHLYMDNVFVNRYWNKHFDFFNDNMEYEDAFDKVSTVIIKDTGEIIDRKLFLSDEYFYGDYTRLVKYIIYEYELDKVVIQGFAGLKKIFDDIFEVDYSIIEEIDSNDCCYELCKMYQNIYEIVYSANNEKVDESKLGLKVLVLDEIKKLILETADFLYDMLRYCEL